MDEGKAMKRATMLLCVCVALVFGLSATVYSADGAALYKRCASCHGADGAKPPHVLRGQTSADLLSKMKGYIEGTFGGQQKAVMSSMLKGFSPEELQTLADHIAGF